MLAKSSFWLPWLPWLLCLLAQAALAAPVASEGRATGCGYLDFSETGEMHGRGGREIRLSFAFPDSLGQIAVGPFLLAKPEIAQRQLAAVDWAAHPLTPLERRFLKALRDWVDGHRGEAASEFAALIPKAPSRLQAPLRIDRAILMVKADLRPEAEKEWLRFSGGKEPCREAARKNLYALYMDGQEQDKAQALVSGILAKEPKDKWANEADGYLSRQALSDEEWGAYLKSKSQGKDSLFAIQLAYARYLKDHKRYEEAKRYYTHGLEGMPRNGPAWLELADVHYRLGLTFLAQASLEKCFAAGIKDPYVYELLGRVLVDLSGYAADRKRQYASLFGELDMHDLQWGLDPAWAERCWRLAERNVESGFSHDLQSRSMAQLLYHLYCHNGRTEAADNLRAGFWFHFTGPSRTAPRDLQSGAEAWEPRLDIRLGGTGMPLVMASSRSDFFEPF
jgi:tetratricopeptide (TPR) repeat protein